MQGMENMIIARLPAKKLLAATTAARLLTEEGYTVEGTVGLAIVYPATNRLISRKMALKAKVKVLLQQHCDPLLRQGVDLGKISGTMEINGVQHNYLGLVPRESMDAVEHMIVGT
jgi:hypothetical protein